jgi:hypothetical protein
VKSDSQETHRLDVPHCFLDETIGFITQIVQVRPIQLVFNPREVGRCEWDDRQSENVMIAIGMKKQKIDHKVTRKLKHVSAITYILAA